eukprot:4801485-Pyramimonas_sp.AAC.1
MGIYRHSRLWEGKYTRRRSQSLCKHGNIPPLAPAGRGIHPTQEPITVRTWVYTAARTCGKV